MGKHVCPWWFGYVLANPIRRFLQDPQIFLAPYVRQGMTVLDFGSGMGFLTIPVARMVGETGKVIAVDIQQKMLNGLQKRASKAGLADRISTKVCEPDTLNVSDLVDLCLAFYVMHEVADLAGIFSQIRNILTPSGRLLVAEPGSWHVSEKQFSDTIQQACASGFNLVEEPHIPGSRSGLLSLKP